MRAEQDGSPWVTQCAFGRADPLLAERGAAAVRITSRASRDRQSAAGAM